MKSIFLSFTIWVLAALLNAMLSGTWMFIFSNEFKHWPAAFFLVFIFTLVFSIPGIFIFWIVLLTNWDGKLLFRCLLRTGFIVSALSLVLYILPLDEIKGQQFFLSACIVIATTTSIMIHHPGIKSIYANKITKAHA